MVMPAQLWVGTAQQLTSACKDYLHKQLCQKQDCTKNCATFFALVNKQHSSVVWLTPSKSYTRADCAVIFEKIVFKLDPDEHFFFIIPYAELLSDATANSLLKTIEEPPVGYHFIFFASRPGALLPTIVSRCITIKFDNEPLDSGTHELVTFFIESRLDKAHLCSKIIDTSLTDQFFVHEFLAELMHYWYSSYKEALNKGDISGAEKALKKQSIIRNSYDLLPMPGSTKQFLRNLFLQLVTHATLT